MTAGTFDPSMIVAILPEIGLLALIALVLIADALWKGDSRRSLGWVTVIGLVVLFLGVFIFSRPPQSTWLVFGGMLRWDGMAFIFTLLFITAAIFTCLFAMDTPNLGSRGEFYLLALTATTGMCLMAAAADLVMVFVAVETTSIPLYALAGFLVRDQKSTEAGFKYMLFGAMTSAVMLYGFSLLYGFTGTTQIYQLGSLLASGKISFTMVLALFLLIFVGLGFKIAAVPMHFWAPDVYEGAPSPVSGFLSTASKAAGFAVILRLLTAIFPSAASIWTIVIGVVSALSMTLGNLMALNQKNIKRMLAYSSIAQAGYILIGVASGTPFGWSSVIFYLLTYMVTNLAAFGIVTIIGKSIGSDEISVYAGLSRRSPGLALALLVALLSLGGIPPFGGFVAKLLVFGSAIQSGMIWLALIGIINSIIALSYYLTVLKVVYLYRSETENEPLPLTYNWRIAVVLCTVLIIAFGVLFGPFVNAAMNATALLF